MKQILCYGDSNTWGYQGSVLNRFSPDVRWTGRLAKMTEGKWKVIEEGLCGRTIAMEDDIQPYRNGLRLIEPCLMSHHPLDCILIMLGTNDTKCRYHLSPGEIGLSMEQMLKKVQSFLRWYKSESKVLLISPASLRETEFDDCELDRTSIEKSGMLSEIFSEIALHYHVEFMDADQCVSSFQNDGCHFSEDGHRQFAEAVLKKLTEIL